MAQATYDPHDYVTAVTQRANEQYGRSADVYQWAKDQTNKNVGISDQVTAAALKNAGIFDDAAKAGVSRYEQMYAPAMKQQLEFAQSYATPEKMALARGRAISGVGQAFDAQAKASADNLKSFGIDPTAVAARLDSTLRTRRAAAEAGAGEQSDINRELTGQQLLSGAITTGQNDAGVTSAFGGQGANDRNQAVQTGLSTTQSGVNAMGNPTAWSGLGNAELGNWAQAEQAQGHLLAQADQINSQDTSGIGSIIGAGLGIASKFLPLAFSGGVVPSFADGGVTPEVTQSPTAIQTGDIVPPGTSVPGIPGQDKVPALVAEGEGVVPKDVMAWRGEQWFQKEIAKARQEMQKQRVTTPQPSSPEAAQMAAQAGPQFASEGAQA